MREEVLRMHDVTLLSQGSVQLEDFSLNVYAGEIVGMLPLNGHGVTAMLELLQSNLPLQSGYVYYREELINSWRSPGIRTNRIAVIKNTSALVERMTVADNIFVLRPGFHVYIIRSRMLVRQLQPVLDDLGIHIAADAYVDTLSRFEKVIVELVKAVIAGCRLIVLREISTIISDHELLRLHEILRHYAKEGISFLCIGFHDEELAQICDRTAIYSNGRILKYIAKEKLPYKEQYVQQVKAQMIGQTGDRRDPVLEIRDLCGGYVQHLSLSVSAGECVVVQDMQNLIFDDLTALLLGERVIEKGEIRVDGRFYAQAHAREIAIISEQPEASMVFEELSYLDNLCMTVDHRLHGIWRNRKLRAGLRREWAQRVGEEVFDKPVGLLSRKQRYDLVFQRILLQRPKAVFCKQPFKGADVGMRMHIWKLIRNLMDEGIAVVILAVNLADALTLAARLIRVEQGSMLVYERSEFDHLPFDAPWRHLYEHIGSKENEEAERI